MGSNDNCDLGIQQRDNNRMTSMCLSESSSLGVESYFNTGWNPILSLTQNGELKGSSMASQNHFHNQSSVSPYGVYGNQGVSTSSSHIVHYPSDPRLTDLAPKFQSFGSGNYSEMVGSLTLPDHTQIANGGCLSNNSRNSSSPDGMKRKRPQFNSIQNETAESHKQKDVSEITLNSNEQNEKKSKSKSENANLGGNQNGKQGKDSTSNGQTPKQDYIHMRARRGQATNSHSLAERVRREKISERMKLLQDLVPGCNKITGKAVMLDEIINYVQSLQQQVEFLSMKLATVNPELNFDIEQILSKDILHSRSLGPEILGFAPRMTSFSPANMNLEGSIQPIQCTNPQLPIMSQTPNSWNNELQTMIQMGFIPNQPLDDMGLNGHMKG